MTTEKDMLDALIQHQVYSYRASTKAVNDLNAEFTSASNSLVSKLRDLLDDLTDAEKEALTLGKYTTGNLKEVKALFDDWYQVVSVQLPDSFSVSAVSLATYEAAYISKLYGEEISLDGEKIYKSAIKKPIVGGQLFDDIWKNLAESTRNKALYAVREGIQNGLNTAQIVQELRGQRVKQASGKFEYVGGIVEQTKNQIETSVRTIRAHVGNAAMQDTFDILGYEYKKFLATIDGRVSKICASLDSKVWKSNDPNLRQPPLHYNCRSILVGTDKDGSMLGKRPFVEDNRPVSKIPKSERDGIIGQVDANTSFSEWFKTADSSFQLEWLGKKRYELYKNGGFELTKFIDPLGKPYTIKELKALDAATFKRLGL